MSQRSTLFHPEVNCSYWRGSSHSSWAQWVPKWTYTHPRNRQQWIEAEDRSSGNEHGCHPDHHQLGLKGQSWRIQSILLCSVPPCNLNSLDRTYSKFICCLGTKCWVDRGKWQQRSPQLDESGLEANNKFLRQYRINKARKTNQYDNLSYCINRMWDKSDPIVMENMERLLWGRLKDIVTSLRSLSGNIESLCINSRCVQDLHEERDRVLNTILHMEKTPSVTMRKSKKKNKDLSFVVLDGAIDFTKFATWGWYLLSNFI